MIADPRFKNTVFEASSIAEHFKLYTQALEKTLSAIDPISLEKTFNIIRDAVQKDRRIYVAGNGGSAAISDHLCCDWMKGTRSEHSRPLRVYSLSANTALLTALGNDCGYENSFSEQVEMLGEKGDVLLLISSSGNSPNILKAAQVAQKKGMTCISFTGFTGGEVRNYSAVNIYVNFNNYGIVEDSHQAIMHCISQYLALTSDRSK